MRLPIGWVFAALIAVTPPTAALARAHSHWFSIKADPSFADVRAQLQVLVDDDGRHAVNSFCVVGERIGSDAQAYVHWRTENRLILWEPQPGNRRAIVGSRRNLDLAHDVVEGSDVGGSTYLLTHATANRILRACREKGMVFSVTRRSRSHG